tara:strand:+ start:18857 stop:19537 length:681 start_codon:yes stop_codon:yes gene_type:complete
MITDHSLTYKKKTLKNIPHILRKRSLEREISKLPKGQSSYADFGCSNGYLTNIFRKILKPKESFGFDYTKNIEKARKDYPEINFELLNLNIPYESDKNYKIISCFETIEHVGDELNALNVIRDASNEKSIILISVPIEIGFIGIIKYLLKRYLFKYELPLNCNDFTYFKALLTSKDISIFRKKQEHYSSHFGYDYRNTDIKISQIFIGRSIEKWNSGSSRFYKISS